MVDANTSQVSSRRQDSWWCENPYEGTLMATDQRTLPGDFTSDAVFRSWGSGVSAQLAAIGLVRTADTGQIDWTTVAKPASGVFGGYEIWRFDDALQATAPVFIKVEYGISNTTTLMLGLTVGTGTNGAGTLTGQVSSKSNVAPQTTSAAGVLLPSFCSGNSGRLF